jgi:hypothetical protein
MERLLAYDVETGGLDGGFHSLLTAYFGIFIRNSQGVFVLQSELDLRIKPNPGERYEVTSAAMNVNKIDLQKHDSDPRTVTVNQAAEKLFNFLRSESDDGRQLLIPGGHNEPFDRRFVTGTLLKDAVWRRFTDYHTMDTMPLAKAYQMQGKIPRDMKIKLENLGRHFNCKVSNEDLHTARGDTHLYVRVLEAMLLI